MFRLGIKGWQLLGAAGAAAVAGTTAAAYLLPTSLAAEAPSPLNPQEWQSFKLTFNTPTPTYLYRFALPDKNQVPGLPVASCLMTRAPIGSVKEDGSKAFVIRPYTPISAETKGHLDLAIKVYPQGKMSQHIHNLDLGDTLDIKGPIPKIPLADIAKRKAVGLVAGGTGITPMLQVVEEALVQKLPLDLTLIYANVSENDIMLKPRIDDLAKKHKNFKVHYVVDKANSKGWKGGVGYITSGMLQDHLPPPGDKSLVLVCGPPPMMKAISGDKLPDRSQGPLEGLLKELGYTSNNVFKF
ncbi:hypothetical protein N2152v2_006060 [Parachlorella kessleri]